MTDSNDPFKGLDPSIARALVDGLTGRLSQRTIHELKAPTGLGLNQGWSRAGHEVFNETLREAPLKAVRGLVKECQTWLKNMGAWSKENSAAYMTEAAEECDDTTPSWVMERAAHMRDALRHLYKAQSLATAWFLEQAQQELVRRAFDGVSVPDSCPEKLETEE